MKLTTIKPLPSSRYRLTFEDGLSMTVEQSVVLDCGLYQGRTLDEDELQALRDCQSQAGAKARAVRITGSTAVSEKELRRRLRQRGEDPQASDEAVDWLKDLGALDDAALARRVAQQAHRKGYGPARIRQLLYQKGVAREHWDQALAGLEDGSEAIDAYLQKNLSGQAPDRKEQQKIIDALRRRGFGWDEIRRGLERYGAMLEELE